jgi:hypothetical protein
MTDDNDEFDPLPGLRANLDQMAAMAPEIARVARAWFQAFGEQGFTDTQALYLTAAQILQNPGTAP